MDKNKMRYRLKGMKQRCYNTNHPEYPTCGGRGITVDSSWLDPEEGLNNFINDVGYPPSEEAKLTRRNTAGNFTKDNMYWLENTPERRREQNRLKGIIRRCHNPDHERYPRYGGRGIYVCDRWLDPEEGLNNFIVDMGPWPGPGYTIDRIDNDGPYSPENCKWSTKEGQWSNRSKSNIQYYEIDGVPMSSWEICELVGDGCKPYVITQRYKNGSRGKELLAPMTVATKYDTPHGPMTTGEIAKLTGMIGPTIIARLKSNPNITWEELTKPPVYQGRSSKNYDTICGPLTILQIAKLGGIYETTVIRRLEKGMLGTELFMTHHQHDPVYIKCYGYMNNSEYMAATGYKCNGHSRQQRQDLSTTQGWLTLCSTATHVLSDGTSITTKDLLKSTLLRPELLAWLMVRYEIPAEILWNHGIVTESSVDLLVAKHTPGNLIQLTVMTRFIHLLAVQLLRRGILLYSLPSREREVHAMMDRLGVPVNRYVLIRLGDTGVGESIACTPDHTVLVKNPDHIVGAVEMVHGGNVRVHIPDTDTTDHQFIMSPTVGVGLLKHTDGTFEIKEYE